MFAPRLLLAPRLLSTPPRRFTRTTAILTTTLTTAGAALVTFSSPAAADPAASGTESVIVVLADQLANAPADGTHLGQRGQQAHGAQQAVLARLNGRKATNIKNFTVGNAFSATVTKAQAIALGTDPAVASVSVDEPVQVAPANTAALASSAAAATGPSAGTNACSADPAKPKLEPEALQTMNVRSEDPTAKTAAALGIDGSGVKVAFIADGINPANAGFKRTNGTSSIVDYQDFYGDGPNAPSSGAEAFGDASAISAQGNVVYDVADFANPAAVSYPGGHCYIKVVGVAPGSNVVALKAGSELLPNSAILQAIDYAVTVAKVDILSESFGANLLPDSGARNTIQLFNDQAVKSGVTITVSTGDAGTTGTIGNPATDPNVISTGATTDSRIYQQTGYALAAKFGNGKWLNDNISSLSSAGITQDGRTIDVSAPGEADWAVCDDGGNFDGCTSWNGALAPIQSFGGTSQSAPLTAGVSALVIQAYRKTHSGTSPTPAVVKQIITSTARDVGFSGEVMGTGRVDARAAVEAALSWPGARSVTPGISANIALSTDQLTVEGTPGTTKTTSVKVTNVGSSPLSVVPATRQYASLGGTEQVTALNPTTDPTLAYPTNAASWIYRTVTFDVPAGTDVLDSTIRWASGVGPNATGPAVRLSLFAPDGTYAANTRPQGGSYPANYGNVLVRQPTAGKWTAVLYTAQTKGFVGNVTLDTIPLRAIPVGSLSTGTFTLAPGASKTVSINVPVPASGGDQPYTVSFGTSTGRAVALPVIVRAIVPTSPTTTGTFTGTITGGNARSSSPAQSLSYGFNVPAGQKDLNVSVTLPGIGDTLEGVLVDPNGQTPSISSNASLTKAGETYDAMTNVVANPMAGRWRYVVVVLNPVTGTALAQPLRGTISFNKQSASIAMPASGLSVVNGKKVYTGSLTVRNPGAAPMAVQIDPRLNTTTQVQLAPQFAGSTFTLPLDVEELSAVPGYLVPPMTKSVSLSAASTVPAQVELSSPGSGIDVFGDLKSAQAGGTVSTASVAEKSGFVGQGFWFTYVQEIGPFGASGAAAASTTLTATATTAAFDTTVTSPVGDPYLSAVDPSAAPGTPVIIPAGGSSTIPLVLAPSARKGTKVSGTLNVVTTPVGVAGLFNTTGDVLAALPYSYVVS